MARFQILSLIGGGIRGAFITSFLKEIEEKLGRPIAECFDLIAGTSTGGIIATGLAAGRSAAEVYDFYVRYGEKIFSPRPKYKAKGYMKLVYPSANWVFSRRTGEKLDPFLRARYCPDALGHSFDEGFGQDTIESIRFTRLIVPTVNLTKGMPHVFRSAHLPEAVADQDVRICDLLLAATAAPTYFPHKQIKDQSFADGALWATDPSMLAFAEAMRIRGECHRGDCDPTYDTSDIHLLSIGTGISQYSWTPPGADAGMMYWARHIADVMGISQIQGIHQPLHFILGDNYTHLNFTMDELWPLDGVANIPKLFDAGSAKAGEEFEGIKQCFLNHQRTQFRPFTPEDVKPEGYPSQFEVQDTCVKPS